MSFEVTDGESFSTVFLSGEIDLERSPAARKTLLDTLRHGKSLVVDMAGVSYIDSSGIASLVEAYQQARHAKLEFSLAHVGGAVLKVLQLARLDKVFPIQTPA
jgi:anti-sigma B factor antagonist